MFNLIVGLACITFFGLGAIILLRQRNFLYTLGCLIFVAIGIFLVLPSSDSAENKPNVTSPQPVNATPVKTTAEKIQPIAPSVTLKNEPKYNQVNQTLLKAVQNIVDSDFTFKTSIKQIELNEHLGTDIPEDFIALVSLSYDALHSEETTKKWIEQYTSHLAAKLSEEPIAINTLVIFWETPRFKEDWNSAKISFVKHDDGQFYFESENYDASVFKK